MGCVEGIALAVSTACKYAACDSSMVSKNAILVKKKKLEQDFNYKIYEGVSKAENLLPFISSEATSARYL